MEVHMMNIGEILSDAVAYPFNNIKALIIYAILGIIASIAVGGSLFAILLSGKAITNVFASVSGIVGFLIACIMFLLISGYELDILKFSINRRSDAPGIDPTRQVINAIKLIIVNVIYYLIPALFALVLNFLLGNGILTKIIIAIIYFVFTFAQVMGKCRLAESDSLSSALSIGEAIGDLFKVGFLKLIVVLVAIVVFIVIIAVIISLIAGLNSIIGSLLLGIFAVYAVFVINRALGLLYSDA